VRNLADSSGTVTGTITYDGFGKQLGSSGAVDRRRLHPGSGMTAESGVPTIDTEWIDINKIAHIVLLDV